MECSIFLSTRGAQVAAISGHEKGGDLSRSVRQELGPAGPTFEDDDDRPGLLALPHEFKLGGYVALVATHGGEKPDIVVGEESVPTQLLDEGVGPDGESASRRAIFVRPMKR
jgi:hypothetical protein